MTPKERRDNSQPSPGYMISEVNCMGFELFYKNKKTKWLRKKKSWNLSLTHLYLDFTNSLFLNIWFQGEISLSSREIMSPDKWNDATSPHTEKLWSPPQKILMGIWAWKSPHCIAFLHWRIVTMQSKVFDTQCGNLRFFYFSNFFHESCRI